MKTFEEQQAELLNNFQRQMKNICSDILSSFYTDVTPYAEVDAHINFRNMIRQETINALINEVKSEHSFYSYAHQVRMTLLKQHKKELQNKIIEDLQEKVKAADERYSQLCKRL